MNKPEPISMAVYRQKIFDLAMQIDRTTENNTDVVCHLIDLSDYPVIPDSGKPFAVNTSTRNIRKKLLFWDNGGTMVANPLVFVKLPIVPRQAVLMWFDTVYGNTDQNVEDWSVEFQILTRMLLHENALLVNPQHLQLDEVLPELAEILGPVAFAVYSKARNLLEEYLRETYVANTKLV